jgi:hypothetical protein
VTLMQFLDDQHVSVLCSTVAVQSGAQLQVSCHLFFKGIKSTHISATTVFMLAAGVSDVAKTAIILCNDTVRML